MSTDRNNCAISVIIPCFNAENYIEDTMKSLFDQTFQDFEIICIDDGSEDETLSRLEGMAVAHPNMIVIPETNHRQGYERNQGIDRAKGKYLYYMDSDDLLEPKCFEALFNRCEKDQLDLLFFEADSFYETPELEEEFAEFKTLYHRKESYPEVYKGEELYVQFRANGDMIVSPCLQMVRRAFLLEKEIRFPELPLMEDNLYLFRCLLAAERVGCIPDRLYRRRVRSASTMTSARQAERKYALGVTFCEIACRAADYAANEGVYNAILEHAQAMIRHMSRSEGEWSGEIRNTIARACREIPAEEVLILLLRLDGMFLHTREQLRKAWDEKSEINRKLQVTYEEKAERGIQINELKEQVKAAKQQTKEIKQHAKEYRLEKKESERALKKSLRKKEAVMRETKEELAETKAELKELKQRFLVRLSLKLGTLFRRKP